MNENGKITDPLVSVVVPVYNVEKYLKLCLRGIREQSYRNLEILLVDDGSTDASDAICDYFATIDKRIRVIHQTNQGLSAARNNGTKLCRGDWTVYVDSDDLVSPHFIEHLLKAALSTHSEVAICKGKVFQDGTPFIAEESNLASILPSERAVGELFSEKKASTSAWGKLASTELWIKHPFPENRDYEDLPTTWKLLADGNQTVLLTGSYYGYRKRNNSISSTPKINSLIDYKKSIQEVWGQATAKYPELIPAISFRCCLEYCRLLEMVAKLESSDSDKGQIQSIHRTALYFLRRHTLSAFTDSYAALFQRLRILIMALAPNLSIRLRR
ncbi:glycosyltransferase [Bifidobacterium sp. ESL0728]|uniref:glycosyltransferase family 2 protein n=1 Tax=Bifidobacterium sp. ESL0728 TaxID=2983220 RepID=UPI0023F956FA|nr:glycosyltransferase [Bifidobacterium sp. ESL0728]WEV59329.1 glycosyltransferase [Bifidobacterium sp. ESL0728]